MQIPDWMLHRYKVYGIAILLRIVALCWAQWQASHSSQSPIYHSLQAFSPGFPSVRLLRQDTHCNVKYTDVDYFVFADAAQLLAEGRSPYERHTYRYTPLLAYLLLPNIYLHPLAGKVLFGAADLLVGYLIEQISFYQISTERDHLSSSQILAAASWLLNPLVINFSSRGSADALIAVLVLATVYFLLRGQVHYSAFYHGLAVHFRLYPIIFSLTYLVALMTPQRAAGEGMWTRFQQAFPKQLQFSLISAVTFLSLSLLCYHLHGPSFLNEALLYHLSRSDNRHNFSPWFYSIYLATSTNSTSNDNDFTISPSHSAMQNEFLYNTSSSKKLHHKTIGIAAFVPQVILLLTSSLKLGNDLPFCIALQTLLFVTFNKVCTAQYFSWYMALSPAAHASLYLPPRVIFYWLCALLSWLAIAYLLEFQGRNTFSALWLASLGFLAVNVKVIRQLIFSHSRREQEKATKMR